MIKLKVTLINLKQGVSILDRVVMRFPGDYKSLYDLSNALEDLKSECNGIANKNGLALRDCEILIFDLQ